MNILIDDIIFYLQRYGGITVYWREITSRILADGSLRVKRLLFLDERQPLVKLTRFLPVFENPFQGQPFIFHSSYYRISKAQNAKNIITVFDFTHRKLGRGLKNSLFIAQQSYAIKKAAGILCISESTKKDLLEFFPNIDPRIVKVAHLGVSEIFLKHDGAQRTSTADHPFILFVGSRAAYKNFDKAVLSLRDFSLNLVIAGADPLSSGELQLLNAALPGRWEFIERPSTEALANLYSKALCLLYPSSYEGFGIPVLEAAACGAPVLACNNSSIPEVAGPSTLLIEEPSVDKIRDAVGRLLSKQWIPDIEAGRKHAQSFSWERCYKETLECYQSYS
jgi:glycosyltransferase involved in cell wall biosynthesis